MSCAGSELVGWTNTRWLLVAPVAPVQVKNALDDAVIVDELDIVQKPNTIPVIAVEELARLREPAVVMFPCVAIAPVAAVVVALPFTLKSPVVEAELVILTGPRKVEMMFALAKVRDVAVVVPILRTPALAVSNP